VDLPEMWRGCVVNDAGDACDRDLLSDDERTPSDQQLEFTRQVDDRAIDVAEIDGMERSSTYAVEGVGPSRTRPWISSSVDSAH
jgi:hypothetical protein